MPHITIEPWTETDLGLPESRMFEIIVSGEPAGSVGYWDKTWQEEGIYEVGWGVIPEFQGRGIALRATELAIERAKKEARHNSIHAFPSVDNAASNRLCEKLGFTLLGNHDFEYPPGHQMRCNDWKLDLKWAVQESNLQPWD
jgi:RimJ/RimL family protein N-acetyltransferase